MDDRTEQLHRALQKFIYHVDKLSSEDDPSGNGFHREYRDLRELGLQNKDTYPATHGKIPYNIKKNRYKDIVPFDETRVKLKEKPGVQGSDYINANYILNAHQREGYIASQGPLPHTLVDFWRMIHELNVKVVMMACREVEIGKKKCAKYWVEEGAENGIFGDYEVACDHQEDIAGDCHERLLQLILPDSTTQDVCQFHYTGWPDHGIPDDIDVILTMIKRMRDIRMHDPDHAPVVVHCREKINQTPVKIVDTKILDILSAGCGRTGTICAIDYAWEILKSGQMTEDFNLFEIVKSMREQRQSMIQTPEQYEMAHLAIKVLFEKHIEIMNETEYVNIELKRDDNYYNVSIEENKDRETDDRKLQKDALDTLERYMGKVEETTDIPEKEPENVSKKPEIVSKKPEIDSKKLEIVSKKPEIELKKPDIVSKESEIKKNSVEDPTVIKLVENNNIQQKVEKEQIQRRPYVNVAPSDGAPLGESDSKTESPSVLNLRNSFQNKQSSPSPTESGPKFSGHHPLNKQISKDSAFPPQIPKNTTPNQGLPPTVPMTTMVSQTPPVSGPRFAGPKTVQHQQQETFHSQPQQSGPRFAPSPHVQQTSPVNSPKFKSVINVGSTSTIMQGNKPQNGIGARQGSIKTKTPPDSADYEMAYPIPDNNRVSTDNVTLNSNSSSAVYAVPDKSNDVPNKTKDTPVIPSNVYSEVKKGHSSKPGKVANVESAYEAIDITKSVKSAPRSRAYEEVQLPSDGVYSSVGDVADQNDAPPVPDRGYTQEPEQNIEQKTSMTDKIKSKFTTTLNRGHHGNIFSMSKKHKDKFYKMCITEYGCCRMFGRGDNYSTFTGTCTKKGSSNSKGSPESTDNKAVPGFNQRLDKKVKGPRTMPWSKKKSKS